MKTLRYRIGNEVKPGILDQEGNIRDVSSLLKDWDNKNVTISKLNEVKKVDPISLPLVENSDGDMHLVFVKKVLENLFVSGLIILIMLKKQVQKFHLNLSFLQKQQVLLLDQTIM